MPITDRDGVEVGVLTVPYIAATFSEMDADSVVGAAWQTAREISERLQGSAA